MLVKLARLTSFSLALCDQLNEILVAVVALVALKLVVIVVVVVAAVVVVVAVAAAAANVDVVLIALKNVCKSQKCQPRRLQRCRPNQLNCFSLARTLSHCLTCSAIGEMIKPCLHLHKCGIR